MTISALPSAPQPGDTLPVFNDKAFAWVASLGTFTIEINALGASVLASADSAAAAAAAATAKAAEAAASAASAAATANVAAWVSGATYAIGDARFSPSTYQTYRRKTAGAGTTDPASDAANWTAISADLTNGPTIVNPTLANSDLKNLRVPTFYQQVNNAATSGAITINWANGAMQKQAEPSGGITYTFTAPPGPCHLQLLIDSDGTSAAKAFTWPASVKWLGAQWSAVANKRAIINFWYDGTNYFAVGVNEA